MTVGVRVGMLYILGRANKVEMATANTFQDISHLCIIWITIIRVSTKHIGHLHHSLLEGDGVPAVLPHHGHVPVGTQCTQIPLYLVTENTASTQEYEILCKCEKNQTCLLIHLSTDVKDPQGSACTQHKWHPEKLGTGLGLGNYF